MNSEKIEEIKSKKIVQGGMGAGVSNWSFARSVSNLGGLGVISGVALDTIMIQRLQKGESKLVEAILKFPNQTIAKNIVDKYYIPGGKKLNDPYIHSPYPRLSIGNNKVLEIENKELDNLLVVANFAEITLAKESHSNPIGINYLYKIQSVFLPSVYGAILAGVDSIFVGAGFPFGFKKVLNELTKGNSASMSVNVIGGENYSLGFDPKNIFQKCPELDSPFFVGVVGNHLGAKALSDADGFVFENDLAGGHNAPNRDGTLTESGEPHYGEKDYMNFGILNRLLQKNADSNGYMQPYWLAGTYANKLNQALEQGANGVQVGTPFAFSRGSGIRPELKKKVLEEIMNGAVVFTSPVASPSGFPFKVVLSKGTIVDPEVYNSRERICNFGYLIELYEENNQVHLRCPAERIENYTRKGGKIENTVGKVCLCHSLLSTIGFGIDGEAPIVTSGSDLSSIKAIVNKKGIDYPEKEVIEYINNPY